ncbi:DUF2304 domain-containing protein [Neolewinella aurantiaca]|uniref:DUF2304 domain-containing protein n=1 Tax=Neolewinella aurantiaca TaxID=2602767 RepID=A0A5C7FGY0_9BACT|nr:DUF2304 domain-containing protein [Neolewinella aurantiaca]TXF85449.1 DUF2304 domain-containing protein [Neolewinella aurantiaca]
MEIRIFQIVVPLLSLIFVLGLATRYQKGRINLRECTFSVLFWVSLAVFSIFPDAISSFVARVFGIADNVNAVIFLGMGILVYLIFMLYGEVRENRKQVTELARKIALRDADKDAEE